MARDTATKPNVAVTAAAGPAPVQIARKISHHTIQFGVEPASVYGAEHLLRLFGESQC